MRGCEVNMVKKTQVILIGLFVLVLICSAFLYNQQKQVNRMKMTLESIVGSSLFNIWSNYDSIISDKTNKLTIEHITDIHSKLSVSSAYSEIVDHATATALLSPINKNMLVLTESIKNSYEENEEFTDDDQAKYSMLVQQSHDLLSIMPKVYYVPESQEGAEVTLKINNKEELIKFRDKLKEYASSIE